MSPALTECDNFFAFTCYHLYCCKSSVIAYILLFTFVLICCIGAIVAVLYIFYLRLILERKTAGSTSENDKILVDKDIGKPIDVQRLPLKNDILLSDHMSKIMSQKNITTVAATEHDCTWENFTWASIQNVPKEEAA